MKKVKLVGFFFKRLWKLDKHYSILLWFSVIIIAVFPFINIIFPMYIVNELCGQKRIEILAKYLIYMIVLDAIFSCLKAFLERAKTLKSEVITLKIQAEISEVIADIDYEHLEDATFLDLESKAMFPIINQNVINEFFNQISLAIINAIRLCGLLYILSLLSVGITIMLFVTIIVYCWCHKKLAEIVITFSKELQPINRKFTYYIHMITDPKWAKDIRLYDAEPMISEKVGSYNAESYRTLKKMCSKSAVYNCIGKACSTSQIVVSYTYIAWLAYAGKILLGQLTMYVSVMIQFAGSVSELVTSIIELLENMIFLESFVEFYNLCISEKENNTNDKMDEKCTKIESIEFRNVSFSYKKAKKKALDNVSFSISRGERVAFVGTNGAGKTTIIKLLLGLFKPSSGQILINGKDISMFNHDAYIRNLTAVFQDFFIPIGDIDEIISIGKPIEQDKKRKVMKCSGLDSIVKNLEKGDKTIIGKQFDKEGIELSGGQKQKLAIGRMLCKDASVFVMDEPTAALDAKAEKDLYDKLNLVAKEEKNALFIFVSHRLSSCSFCNRIMVFDDAHLVEQGTHDELLNSNGLYRQMWNSQKAYYA